MGSLNERFSTYFDREPAQLAARTLADGCEIQFDIAGSDGKVTESFTFTKENGKNKVLPSAASSPQLTFTVTPQAAEAILSDSSDDIGTIGVGIMRLVVS